jgi:hypothetical protein
MPTREPTPLTSDQVREWWARIDLDRQKRKKESQRWRRLLAAYLPPTGASITDLSSNIHFRNTQLKIAEIWAQLPELHLTALEPLQGVRDPQTGQPMEPATLAAIKKAVLGKLLGRDHADVDATVRAALFDVFATSGIGWTKICYEVDTQPIEQQVPGPPVAQPGAVLGLQTMPGPMVTQMVPVPVCERWRWYKFSAEKAILPYDFTSTDFDEAPYLGMEFVEPFTPQAAEKYRLPQDFQPNESRDDMLLTADRDAMPSSKTMIKGVELWLHASRYDPAVAHAQVFYRLVLIEGMRDQAAIYEQSPYQTIGPDGRLTPDSMIGSPIHPVVLRTVSDMAYVPSDSAFTDPLVSLENLWTKQDVLLRESNIARFFHSDAISVAVDQLKDADVGQGVAIPAGEMAKGIGALMIPLPHLEHAQSDSAGRQEIQRALQETLGLGANQAGTYSSTTRSATEVATIQQNVSVRLKSEQNIALSWFLKGVRKFDALAQRYLTERGYVELVGPDGVRALVAFTQAHLSGRYAYDAHPDSQLSMDQSTRIKRAIDYINFLAKSPFLNQKGAAELITSEFGYDPSRLIADPQPPPSEKPNISFRFSGPDLAIPEVRAILQAAGIPVQPAPSPEAIMAHQLEAAKALPHGGTAERADTLSKHHAAETDQQPGRPTAVGPVPAAPAPRVQ